MHSSSRRRWHYQARCLRLPALMTFEAFDGLGQSLGAIGPYLLGDGNDTGQKEEDRFFGAFYEGRISAVRIATNNADWEVDHLQYGSTAAVPESSTIMLVGIGAIGLLCHRMKQRS